MPFTQAMEPATLSELTRFLAPKAAFDVIDAAVIIQEATEDGVEMPYIEIQPVGACGESVRVSCNVEMALRLLCVWIETAGRTPADAESEDQLTSLRRAAVAVYGAYDVARAAQ